LWLFVDYCWLKNRKNSIKMLPKFWQNYEL
jgi:hypothetical protein